MIVIDESTRTKLRTAFLSSDLHIGNGVGTYSEDPAQGERCTIAEINLVLTGVLTDKPHPCISEVIRRWVIRVQDGMPDEMRNSREWREAAIGIAGSAASDEVEQRRVTLIQDWMWNALADESVITSLPQGVRPAWTTMLTERTATAAWAAWAARAVADAARATADAARATAASAAYAVAYAADAAAGYAADAADAAGYVAANADASYWERRNPAQLLTELIEIS